MGYVFDALSRLDDRDREPAAAAPTPDLPAPGPLAGTGEATDAAAAPAPEPAESPTVEAAIETEVEVDAEPEPDRPAGRAAPLAFDAPPLADGECAFDDRLVVATEPGSAAAEEYRSIRTAMLARLEQRRRLIHTVTSATPQEGKTITSLNLGLAFAELRNRRTVVVEADLRLPTFDNLLHIGPCKGAVHHLRGEAALDDVIRPVPGTRLHVIPAGERSGAEAVQLLSGGRFAAMIDALRDRFDHVILDTPPAADLADAGIVGAMSDEVLLVVRMGRTPRPLVEATIRTLRGLGAPVGGVIATDQRWSRHRQHYGRYGYQYRYITRKAA